MGQNLFGGKPSTPNPGKYAIVLHKSPESVSVPELSSTLMFAGVLADVKAVGIDPTKVHLQLTFKETGHVMCFNLEKGVSTGQDQPFGIGSCN